METFFLDCFKKLIFLEQKKKKRGCFYPFLTKIEKTKEKNTIQPQLGDFII